MPQQTQIQREPAPTHDTRSAAVRRVLACVLLLNTLVLVVKIIVGARTGALTVIGAALESGLDLLNNLIGMTLVSVAAREPDEDHPYGHAKFESLGAIGIVGFLSISCFELMREAVAALLNHTAPQATTSTDFGLLLLTLAVNATVVIYERRRGRALRSAFLVADAAHTRGDVFITLLAVASLWLTRAGDQRVDAILGVTVALLIAWSGWHILRASVPILVDARGMDAAELRRIAGAIPGILDVRTVRSRSTAAGQLFAEMTIVVSGGLSVADAHALADQVEAEVARVAEGAEVVVHIEPA